MKPILALFICIALLSSCDKKLSNGKYVKATIISTAESGDIGMIEFHSQEHNDSYVALFDGDMFPNNKLNQEVYAKINAKGKIPFAKDLTTTNPGTENMYGIDVKTTINYHSSTNHKVNGGGFHTKMHYQGGLAQDPVTENYSVPLYKSDGTPVTGSPFNIPAPLANLLETYGQGVVYTDIDVAADNINQIDTCHRHGSRIIKCRADE